MCWRGERGEGGVCWRIERGGRCVLEDGEGREVCVGGWRGEGGVCWRMERGGRCVLEGGGVGCVWDVREKR